MCDSSLRTHPSLLLLLLHYDYYYYYYYYFYYIIIIIIIIIIYKRRDEEKENATQVQAVMSVRDLRNLTHVTLGVTLLRSLHIHCLSTILHDVAICPEKICVFDILNSWFQGLWE